MLHNRPSAAFQAIDQSVIDARFRVHKFLFLTQNSSLRFVAEACADILRSANSFLERDQFTWQYVNGVANLRQDNRPNLVSTALVLIGGTEQPWHVTDSELSSLKPRINSATRVCVVGAGVFLPLSAGFLDQQSISVHPNFRISTSEMTDEVDIMDAPVTHSGRWSSATGNVAASIMISDLVGKQAGGVTKRALDEHLGLVASEQTTNSKLLWQLHKKSQGDPTIEDAISLMVENIDEPLPIYKIANGINTSPRQLERTCKARLGMTPKKLYRCLQIVHAHQLLTQTDLSITEVSVASGFNSVGVLSKWYRDRYGATPSQTRRQFRYGRELAG